MQGRLDAAEEDDATSIEVERRERIEKWRMEQSRLLMDEIEKETRRRRASFTSQRVGHAPATAPLEQVIEDTINAHIGDNVATAPLNACPPATEDSETFWQRVTRRVIRDFIGFDDNLLSIIFGESLPAENPVSSHSYLVPSSSTRLDNFVPPPSICSGWERRLLDRLVRELGILVQQLSVHPGAFSVPYNPSTTDYAGMPITAPTSSRTQTKSHAPSVNTAATTTNPHSFDFQPTLRNAEVLPPTSTADSTHAALWGIEEEPAPILEDDRDYWEQTPDIKTVFRFLHNRLTSQRRPATTSKPPLNIATTSTPDSLRRAAIIRQYHPLVFRAAAAWEQRHGHARRHGLLRGRSGCSCASSIGGSVRRGVGLRAGSLGSSSRNYWDIGGSTVGSGGGSAIGVGGGGMGAWGEV